MNAITITPASPAHYSGYVALINSQLGEDYMTVRDFEAMAADAQALIFAAVERTDGDKVLGVVTGRMLDKDSALSLLKIQPEQLPEYAKNSQYIGILKTIAVSPSSQGRGVGSALVRTLLDALAQAGVDSVACVAWQYHDAERGAVENVRGLMDSFGFHCCASIRDYWAEEC